MFNLAYSPFNRSYQFMHLQNSAYHLKNKRNAKPIVKTNIKKSVRKSLSSHKYEQPSQRAHRYSSSQANHDSEGRMTLSRGFSASLKNPYRLVHKNQVIERAKSARISRQNMGIVQRILGMNCMVESKSTTEQFYKKQKKYKSLRRKYQESGERLVTPLGNMKLLNPTLASFRTSQANTRRLMDQEEQYQKWVS